MHALRTEGSLRSWPSNPSVPNNDTPIWMQDQGVFTLDWFTLSGSHLVQCTKRYLNELKRWRSSKKQMTTSRLKGILKKIMSFLRFHITYLDRECMVNYELEDDLACLLAIFIDMELKVWMENRKNLVKQNIPLATFEQNLSEKLVYWLYMLLKGRTQRTDCLLNIHMAFVKHCRPILDPIFRKVFSEMDQGPQSDEMYVRYMLLFKIWREQVLINEDESSIALKTFIVSNLVSQSPFSQFDQKLRSCLRNPPPSVADVPKFHMIPNNINLRDACDQFLKCDEMKAKVNIQFISNIQLNYIDDADEEDEVENVMKDIDQRRCRKRSYHCRNDSKTPESKPIFIDLTEEEQASKAECIKRLNYKDEQEKRSSNGRSYGMHPFKSGCHHMEKECDAMYISPKHYSFIFMCACNRRRRNLCRSRDSGMCRSRDSGLCRARDSDSETESVERKDRRSRRQSRWRNEEHRSIHHIIDDAVKDETLFINEDEVDEEKDTDTSQDSASDTYREEFSSSSTFSGSVNVLGSSDRTHDASVAVAGPSRLRTDSQVTPQPVVGLSWTRIGTQITPDPVTGSSLLKTEPISGSSQFRIDIKNNPQPVADLSYSRTDLQVKVQPVASPFCSRTDKHVIEDRSVPIFEVTLKRSRSEEIITKSLFEVVSSNTKFSNNIPTSQLWHSDSELCVSNVSTDLFDNGKQTIDNEFEPYPSNAKHFTAEVENVLEPTIPESRENVNVSNELSTIHDLSSNTVLSDSVSGENFGYESDSNSVILTEIKSEMISVVDINTLKPITIDLVSDSSNSCTDDDVTVFDTLNDRLDPQISKKTPHSLIGISVNFCHENSDEHYEQKLCIEPNKHPDSVIAYEQLSNTQTKQQVNVTLSVKTGYNFNISGETAKSQPDPQIYPEILQKPLQESKCNETPDIQPEDICPKVSQRSFKNTDIPCDDTLVIQSIQKTIDNSSHRRSQENTHDLNFDKISESILATVDIMTLSSIADNKREPNIRKNEKHVFDSNFHEQNISLVASTEKIVDEKNISPTENSDVLNLDKLNISSIQGTEESVEVENKSVIEYREENLYDSHIEKKTISSMANTEEDICEATANVESISVNNENTSDFNVEGMNEITKTEKSENASQEKSIQIESSVPYASICEDPSLDNEKTFLESTTANISVCENENSISDFESMHEFNIENQNKSMIGNIEEKMCVLNSDKAAIAVVDYTEENTHYLNVDRNTLSTIALSEDTIQDDKPQNNEEQKHDVVDVINDVPIKDVAIINIPEITKSEITSKSIIIEIKSDASVASMCEYPLVDKQTILSMKSGNVNSNENECQSDELETSKMAELPKVVTCTDGIIEEVLVSENLRCAVEISNCVQGNIITSESTSDDIIQEVLVSENSECAVEISSCVQGEIILSESTSDGNIEEALVSENSQCAEEISSWVQEEISIPESTSDGIIEEELVSENSEFVAEISCCVQGEISISESTSAGIIEEVLVSENSEYAVEISSCVEGEIGISESASDGIFEEVLVSENSECAVEISSCGQGEISISDSASDGIIGGALVSQNSPSAVEISSCVQGEISISESTSDGIMEEALVSENSQCAVEISSCVQGEISIPESTSDGIIEEELVSENSEFVAEISCCVQGEISIPESTSDGIIEEELVSENSEFVAEVSCCVQGEISTSESTSAGIIEEVLVSENSEYAVEISSCVEGEIGISESASDGIIEEVLVSENSECAVEISSCGQGEISISDSASDGIIGGALASENSQCVAEISSCVQGKISISESASDGIIEEVLVSENSQSTVEISNCVPSKINISESTSDGIIGGALVSENSQCAVEISSCVQGEISISESASDGIIEEALVSESSKSAVEITNCVQGEISISESTSDGIIKEVLVSENSQDEISIFESTSELQETQILDMKLNNSHSEKISCDIKESAEIKKERTFSENELQIIKTSQYIPVKINILDFPRDNEMPTCRTKIDDTTNVGLVSDFNDTHFETLELPQSSDISESNIKNDLTIPDMKLTAIEKPKPAKQDLYDNFNKCDALCNVTEQINSNKPCDQQDVIADCKTSNLIVLCERNLEMETLIKEKIKWCKPELEISIASECSDKKNSIDVIIDDLEDICANVKTTNDISPANMCLDMKIINKNETNSLTPPHNEEKVPDTNHSIPIQTEQEFFDDDSNRLIICENSNSNDSTSEHIDTCDKNNEKFSSDIVSEIEHETLGEDESAVHAWNLNEPKGNFLKENFAVQGMEYFAEEPFVTFESKPILLEGPATESIVFREHCSLKVHNAPAVPSENSTSKLSQPVHNLETTWQSVARPSKLLGPATVVKNLVCDAPKIKLLQDYNPNPPPDDYNLRILASLAYSSVPEFRGFDGESAVQMDVKCNAECEQLRCYCCHKSDYNQMPLEYSNPILVQCSQTELKHNRKDTIVKETATKSNKPDAGIIRSKRPSLETKIKTLTEKALKNAPNNINNASPNETLNIFVPKPQERLAADTDLSMIIPNTAHLQLCPDDDEILPLSGKKLKIYPPDALIITPLIKDSNNKTIGPPRKSVLPEPCLTITPVKPSPTKTDTSLLKHSVDKILQSTPSDKTIQSQSQVSPQIWSNVVPEKVKGRIKINNVEIIKPQILDMSTNITPRRTRSQTCSQKSVSPLFTRYKNKEIVSSKPTNNGTVKQITPPNSPFGYIRSTRPGRIVPGKRKIINNLLSSEEGSEKNRKPTSDELFDKLLKKKNKTEYLDKTLSRKCALGKSPVHDEINKNEKSIDTNKKVKFCTEQNIDLPSIKDFSSMKKDIKSQMVANDLVEPMGASEHHEVKTEIYSLRSIKKFAPKKMPILREKIELPKFEKLSAENIVEQNIKKSTKKLYARKENIDISKSDPLPEASQIPADADVKMIKKSSKKILEPKENFEVSKSDPICTDTVVVVEMEVQSTEKATAKKIPVFNENMDVSISNTLPEAKFKKITKKTSKQMDISHSETSSEINQYSVKNNLDSTMKTQTKCISEPKDNFDVPIDMTMPKLTCKKESLPKKNIETFQILNETAVKSTEKAKIITPKPTEKVDVSISEPLSKVNQIPVNIDAVIGIKNLDAPKSDPDVNKTLPNKILVPDVALEPIQDTQSMQPEETKKPSSVNQLSPVEENNTVNTAACEDKINTALSNESEPSTQCPMTNKISYSESDTQLIPVVNMPDVPEIDHEEYAPSEGSGAMSNMMTDASMDAEQCATAVEVVKNWFNSHDSKPDTMSYIEVTYQSMDDCNFFEEVSNSSVVSHGTSTHKDKDKNYDDYLTPDSGVILDEDKMAEIPNRSKNQPEQLFDQAAIESVVTENVQQVIDVSVEDSTTNPEVEEFDISTTPRPGENSNMQQIMVSISLDKLTEILPIIRKRKRHDSEQQHQQFVCKDRPKRRKVNADHNDTDDQEIPVECAESSSDESQSTIQTEDAKKDYSDCLYGIGPSPTCYSYPTEMSQQDLVYEEGGIDLYRDYYSYYSSFDSLKEQQPIQTGYCAMDNQFSTLTEFDDLFSLSNKKMVTVSMNEIQPKKKSHSENADEVKQDEFSDYEMDNNYEGFVDGVCKNLDSETLPPESSGNMPAVSLSTEGATSSVSAMSVPTENVSKSGEPTTVPTPPPVNTLYTEPPVKVAVEVEGPAAIPPSLIKKVLGEKPDRPQGKDDTWRENTYLVALIRQMNAMQKPS